MVGSLSPLQPLVLITEEKMFGFCGCCKKLRFKVYRLRIIDKHILVLKTNICKDCSKFIIENWEIDYEDKTK